jgi:hypothetical protein
MVCFGSKEVISCTSTTSWNSSLIFGYRTEYTELGAEVFANVHDGCDVAAAVTVVGCGPDCYDRLLGEMVLRFVSTDYLRGVAGLTYLVTFINQLMGTGNEF